MGLNWYINRENGRKMFAEGLGGTGAPSRINRRLSGRTKSAAGIVGYYGDGLMFKTGFKGLKRDNGSAGTQGGISGFILCHRVDADGDLRLLEGISIYSNYG